MHIQSPMRTLATPGILSQGIMTVFDVYYGLKPAKNRTYAQLDRNLGVPFGSINDGQHVALKRLSGIYIREFNKWAEKVGFKARVALVSIPSSVPEECYHSRPMIQVSCWWEEWANARRELPYQI
ncbi:hypothetical protein ACEV8G_01280 [Vibrio parahaemolyticus]|nr:hypothetical protein [Vibrio parahaemolyticus]HCH1486031.1 hypothetical protein [Vibrio parahaemolyticus]